VAIQGFAQLIVGNQPGAHHHHHKSGRAQLIEILIVNLCRDHWHLKPEPVEKKKLIMQIQHHKLISRYWKINYPSSNRCNLRYVMDKKLFIKVW
jgi:hypothetical protein